jgi:Domain of unknown function (DUF4345)
LKNYGYERRLLQLAVFLAASIAVVSGMAGALRGSVFFELSGTITGDSHARYFSGLLLGVGLTFWSTIPAIERNGSRLRILSFLVLCGGAARLCAIIIVGRPHAVAWLALLNETLVPILLCLWQIRISRGANNQAGNSHSERSARRD